MVSQSDAILNPATPFCGRWGCYFCCLAAAAERLAGREFRPEELDQLLGRAILAEAMFHANYKNHARLAAPAKGWSGQQDPEYHFYIADAAYLLTLAVQVLSGARRRFEVRRSVYPPVGKSDLAIAEHGTAFGSHFILVGRFGDIYNPDEGVITTTIKSYRCINELP